MRHYRRLQVLLVRFLYRSTCHIGQRRRLSDVTRGSSVQGAAQGSWWHSSNGNTTEVALQHKQKLGPARFYASGGTAAAIGYAPGLAHLGPHQRLELTEIN